MIELPTPKIFTVSEMTRSIKVLLETEFPFVTVTGEVSNLRQPFSGHIYFTLKDEGAQIQAVLFKQQQRYSTTPTRDGDQVICRGRIAVYEPRGSYQMIVDFIEAKGVGLLQVEFEACKQKLAAEGLFDRKHKQKIPLLPERVALVTSPSGAAVHDFLVVASKRFPSMPVEIVPVAVQGENAAQEIRAALAALNRREDISVIVLCRGGGSLEDLWPFNNEQLARAIFASTIPVVSAVGHEIDFTIADFVADLRAPTPSAAAEMIIPDRVQLLERVASLGYRLSRMINDQLVTLARRVQTQQRILGDPRALLTNYTLRLDHQSLAMVHAITRKTEGLQRRMGIISSHLQKENPAHRIAAQGQHLSDVIRRMRLAGKMVVSRKQNEVRQVVAVLEAMGPERVLGRGYAIVRDIGSMAVLRSVDQTAPGKNVAVQLHDGKLLCEVKELQGEERPE